MNLSKSTVLSVRKRLGQNCTNRWNHKGWVVCEDTLLGVPVGAEQEFESKGRTLCLQCRAGLGWRRNPGPELKALHKARGS